MLPHPTKRPVTHHAHGRRRVDVYDWMRADNWQEVMADPAKLAPEIRAHLEAENAQYSAYWATRTGLKEQLFEELKGRIKEQDDTLATKNKTHAYWLRYAAGQQYPALMRAPAHALDQAVLVWDQNAAAAQAPYYAVGLMAADPSDRWLILGEDRRGSEYYDLRVLDMVTGTFLADQLPMTGGGGVWEAQSTSFLYLRLDASHRPYQVLRHVLGQDVAQDEILFEETDPGYFLSLSKSESGAYIFISSGDHISSELHLLPADDVTAAPLCLARRQTGHEYSVTHVGDWLYILTNQGGDAEDFEVVKAPITAPTRENWQPHIPHQAGRLILSIFATDGHLMRLERAAALPRLIIETLATGQTREVDFDEPAYTLSAGTASHDFADQTLRFTYASPTTPAQTYDYDLRTHGRVLRKTQEVPSGHDPSAYVVERHFVTARDGARVPLTLLRRRETKGSAPAYVYGYGAYGIATPAGFSSHAFSLVDRGMIYVIAHIRGGTEQGYGWYLDGKLSAKQNSFNDFEDCVRFLIDEGRTTAGRIAIEGGSAGGLLLGAVMNQAPELFGAVVAHVPFVDVLSTISDPSLPLTPIEWNEWGNPIEDVQAYDCIRAYSPYDQVQAQAYPPLMVTAGLTDPRVTYWEPAKWVARLRDQRCNLETLILKTNMTAGHGGRSGRFEHLWEKAEAYGFILSELGLVGE